MMSTIPKWLELSFSLKPLPDLNPADLPSPEREMAAHQMLLAAEMLEDPARLSVLLKLAVRLNSLELSHIDAQVPGFWLRVVQLQEWLAAQGNRGRRALIVERDVQVYTHFKIAGRGPNPRTGAPGLSYSAALEAVATHNHMTVDAVKKALARMERSPLFEEYDLGRMS